ncbi:hypothetical protein Tco_0508690 [Tanacetum coccineum]
MMKPPTHLNNHHIIVPSVEVRLVVYIVDNVLVSGVEEIIRMKFVLYAVMKLKNHSLMIQIQILSLILQIFSTHLHNPRRILVSYVETMLIMVTIVHLKFRLSIIRNVLQSRLLDNDFPQDCTTTRGLSQVYKKISTRENKHPNGDQATTDPASSSAPKTSLAANARRNNEKALNILLSAIPDRHLLSFHDATNAKTLWTAIKARFGGNDASKKRQKELLKQQFRDFTIGTREELDSAYERFSNILSMLELYDAKFLEDANLEVSKKPTTVCQVVATIIRGPTGLAELEFDDLYNNLKVYEHELKGVSNSNSQNIAFLSTEVKGSTLKQSTVEPAHIPKGYNQAASSKVQTAPNCASYSDEIICSFFAQQASMPTTHDDERYCCKLMKML